MPKPQGLTPAQQRERRSKIMAIGASVVFVIVLAVQAPKLLHGSKKTTAVTAAPVASTPSVITAGPAAARTAAAQTAASSALPTLDGQTAAPVAAPATLPALSATGQLATFHLFPNKNPFRAQVNTAAEGASSPSKSSSSSSSSPSASSPAGGSSPEKPSRSSTSSSAPLAGLGSPNPAPVVPAPATKPAPKPKTATFTKPKPKPKAKPKPKPRPLPPNAALISTNGRQQVVPVGVGFPQQNPLFELVKLSVEQKLVRIGVLDGSFIGKSATLPLRAGQKLTLANESDGSHYVVKVLKLVHISPEQLAAIEQPAQATASATSTQPAATTTDAATTTAATTTTTAGTPPAAPAAPATTTPSSNLTAGTKR